MFKIGGTHLQCVNNHYVKFEYKIMKAVGVTDCTNQTPPAHFGWKKMSKFNTRHLSNVHKMGGAHLLCVNTHYAKFETKEMKTVQVKSISKLL